MNKRLWGALGVAALFLAIWADARVTGTPPTNPDALCAGAEGAEACVDADGNVIPTTDNDADLGTSSLKWKDLHLSGDLSLGDDATITGDLSVTGDLTVSGNSQIGNASSDISTFTAIISLPAFTNTQLKTLTPEATGHLALNISDLVPCLSSGTTPAAWVAITTYTAATIDRVPCWR